MTDPAQDLELITQAAFDAGVLAQKLRREGRDAAYKEGDSPVTNADLATDTMLAGSQVSRFLVLHKELDADDGELTRTNKVRRGFIADKYAVLVDALYAGRTEQYIETQVKFEDGRTGSVSATLKLSDTKTFAPVKKAA